MKTAHQVTRKAVPDYARCWKLSEPWHSRDHALTFTVRRRRLGIAVCPADARGGYCGTAATTVHLPDCTNHLIAIAAAGYLPASNRKETHVHTTD